MFKEERVRYLECSAVFKEERVRYLECSAVFKEERVRYLECSAVFVEMLCFLELIEATTEARPQQRELSCPRVDR